MTITRCVEFSRLYIHPIMEHNSLKQLLNILFYIFRTFVTELFGELLAVTYDMPTDTYQRSRMTSLDTEPSAQPHSIQNQKDSGTQNYNFSCLRMRETWSSTR
jgi:hypothetical protein